MKQNKIKSYFLNFFRMIGFRFIYFFKKDLSDCKTVLDLGCGPDSKIKYSDVPYKVGVDLFDPYLASSKEKKIHNRYIKKDIIKVNFEPKSFDAVVMIDVLEHLSKEDGLAMLDKIENWATKKIILCTPNGHVHQDGYDDNPLQEHISSWDIDEFKKRGYKVFGLHGFRIFRGYRGGASYKPEFFWRAISNLSQVLAYFFPRSAFHIYAVKEMK